MKKIKVLPHESIILCKRIIKDFNIDIKVIEDDIKELNFHLNEILIKLDSNTSMNRNELFKKRNMYYKKVAQKECILNTLKATRRLYEIKCRELREIERKLKYYQSRLKFITTDDEILSVNRNINELLYTLDHYGIFV